MEIFYAATFGITIGVLLLLRRAAPRLGLVDHPTGHRTHRQPAALVGGISIFVSFLFGLLLLPIPLGDLRYFFVGSLILVFVGVLDDVHELSSWSRFVAQIAAALIMVYPGGVALDNFGDLVGFGPLELGLLATPVTVFATVGVINALNMSDGADGLAGALFFVPFLSLLWLGSVTGDVQNQPVMIMLLMCVAGFLLLNVRMGLRPQASIFLGDAGSMFLGFVLTWFFIRYTQAPLNIIDPVTALWLVAVPLFDTLSVMIRRTTAGLSPFKADRTHLHHLLEHAGFGHNRTVLAITCFATGAAVFGIVTEHYGWPEPLRFLFFLLLFAAHFAWTQRYVIRQRILMNGEIFAGKSPYSQ